MKNSIDAETVLYAFSVEPTHSAETLYRYLDKYPELTEELVDLALELRFSAVQNALPVEEIANTESQAAWQEFIACAPATAPSDEVELLAHFKGPAFLELASKVGLPRSILIAFRDRLVEPSTIPELLLGRFAKATQSNIDAIREYFSRPPSMEGAAAFKADEKPEQQGRVSFRQLVENTQLTGEERQALLRECDDDGPD